MDHLQAYLYDVDEPYFRLLAPHCERFVGRSKLLEEIMEGLESRHPVISLDGVGGVGKTALAIEVIRQLYDRRRYYFVVSLSAKSRIWQGYQGYTSTRPAGFSGFTEFLREIARVLQLDELKSADDLKHQVIETMRDLDGLLLVDNIEDIHDPDVLRFIGREVPAPVKCLVTSRVDRGLGALTIPITEMNEDEARQLLSDELRRLGYPGFSSEFNDLAELIRITQGLPLAIKWAATLAFSCGSLREAAARLRRSDIGKREFLNFCFKTMFETLSATTKEVALLCTFLREEWNISSVCVALDLPDSDVERAFNELKDRGIIFASTNGSEAAFTMLPLTADFLAAKWHENAALRNRVTRHLRDVLATGDSEGILLTLPKNERIPLIRRRAEDLLKIRDFTRAMRLVRLALQWGFDRELNFLEGRILYDSGEVLGGISCMRAALKSGTDVGKASAEELLCLGDALLRHGGNDEQTEGLDYIEDGSRQSGSLPQGLAEEYVRIALGLRQYRSIKRMLDRKRDLALVYEIVRAMLPFVENRELIEYCGGELLTAVKIVEESDRIREEDRKRFLEASRTIRSLIGL
jgi:hypothetical protein